MSPPGLTPALLINSRRYLLRHPWQTWLSIIGIALGVAVVIAVDLANESARRGFRLSVEQVTGAATHQIESASGDIPDQTYARLRIEHGLTRAAPVIDAAVRIAGRHFTLLGTDPISASTMQTTIANADPGALIRLLAQPNSLALTVTDARELGVTPGASLPVELNGETRDMRVAGLLPDDGGLAGLIVTDIATAQEVLGWLGRIERIDLALDPAAAAALARQLPAGLQIKKAARRGEALEQMIHAFQTNLTAMSLLAVLVGGFIIYNTMTFAVLQRRALLGTLRLLGVTRSQLFALVLIEALALAVAGAVLGVLLGIVVGAGLVRLVTQTINDIYFVLSVRDLDIEPFSLLKGVCLGLGVTFVATWGPALEAARSQPRDVLRRALVERRGERLLPWLAGAGGLIALGGFLLIELSERSMVIGFAALFLVIVGVSLGVPLAVRLFAVATTPMLGRLFGTEGRLAARGITASITRSGLAVAALAVAVSASVGVSIMIGSFRTSVSLWLENTLISDIYLSAERGASDEQGASLPADLAGALASIPGVIGVSQGRGARVETRDGPVSMLALEASYGIPRGFQFQGATAANLWPRWQAGDLVLVSEPFAFHQRVDTGDHIELFTSTGWRDFKIGGVFRDYSSDSGMLVLPRPIYARLWLDPAVSSLGVVLAPRAHIGPVQEAVEALIAPLDTPITVQSNRSIRERSMAVFDRTFTITRVLRFLAVGVAFVGILSALMALELERARDYAVLRATGMTRGQLRRLILLQTSAMGIAAGVLAIPLGLIMGDLLIRVINLRSFGWTMPMLVQPSTLLLGLGLAWLAALLAALYPAWRAGAIPPARALREE